MLKRVMLIAALLWAGAGYAKGVLNLNSFSAFNAGSGSNVDAGAQYGQLRLAAASGLFSDEFDQSFLKERWTLDPASLPSFGSNSLVLRSDGLSYGKGMHSAYFAPPQDLTITARVRPLPYGNSAGLYISGAPWNNKHYGIYTQESSGICLVYVSYFDGNVTKCGTSTAGGNTNWITLRLIKQGNTLSSSFKDDAASVFTDVASNTNTAVIDFSAANISFGIGFITCTACSAGGSVEIDSVQAYPLASHGTWTSATLDRGGVPVQAGSLGVNAQVPSGASLNLFSQSSNDGSTWSAWQSQAAGALVCPMQRYVRLRADMDSSSLLDAGPVISSLSVDQPDQDGDLLPEEEFKIQPNPVRGTQVLLRYVLSRRADEVKAEIFDASHRLVTTLDAPLGVGEQRILWDASKQANGVYFARILARDSQGQQQAKRKIALLR